jgi:hypothetical protein
VAPLRLGGLRGKQSTPSDWLGGTGVVSTVGERERHGAGDAFSSAFCCSPQCGDCPKLLCDLVFLDLCILF